MLTKRLNNKINKSMMNSEHQIKGEEVIRKDFQEDEPHDPSN